MPRRVRQQVVENLDDARAVGHHLRQVFRQVDAHGAADRAADERVPCLVQQRGQLRRLGRNRQRAGHHAPVVEQIGDQSSHVVRLPVDDPEELQHLGRVGGR